MSPNITRYVCLFILCALGALAKPPLPRPEAQWTVMVYMNAGDTSLDKAAIDDFKEMATVRDDQSVNVVVQLDRGHGITSPRWTGTARFLIREKEQPVVDENENQLLYVKSSMNMADSATLKGFVRWSVSNFPAKRYALVMWCHGAGYRDMTPAASNATPVEEKTKKKMAPAGATPQPTKSCSFDEGRQLYNAELARAVRQALDELAPGRKLDLLAFDSCLMGMIETAYAMQPIADVLIGSEELVSGYGFDYGPWLKTLVAKPGSNGMEAATAAVTSFGTFYDKKSPKEATLAAIDIRNAVPLGKKISALADALRADPSLLKTAVASVRKECSQYAPREPIAFLHVDLRRFARLLAERPGVPPAVQALALDVSDTIDNAVGKNYAGADRKGNYGSYGLAVYFPESGSAYANDLFSDGSYEKSAPAGPDAIAFVHEQTWADFLQAYFKAVP